MCLWCAVKRKDFWLTHSLSVNRFLWVMTIIVNTIFFPQGSTEKPKSTIKTGKKMKSKASLRIRILGFYMTSCMTSRGPFWDLRPILIDLDSVIRQGFSVVLNKEYSLLSRERKTRMNFLKEFHLRHLWALLNYSNLPYWLWFTPQIQFGRQYLVFEGYKKERKN